MKLVNKDSWFQEDVKKVNILVFCLLYFSNDTLLIGTNKNQLFFFIHIGVLVCLFLWLLFDKAIGAKENKWVVIVPRNIAAVIMLLSALAVLTMAINRDLSIKYSYQLFMLLFSGLFVICVNITTFIESYNQVIYRLATASIIAMAVSKVFPTVISFLPIVTNTSGKSFRFYGVGFVEEASWGGFTRNYGIFREPGVFAIFLLLAIVFELFFVEKSNMKRIFVVIVSALLTFSTMIYLVLLLVMAIYLGRVARSGQSARYRMVMGILALLMLVIFVVMLTGNFDSLFGMIFNKLFTANSSRDSRTSAIWANLDLTMNNPFFGNGFSFVEENFELYSLKYTNHGGHNTNTFLKIMSVYGVPFCLITMISLYRFFRLRNGVVMSCALFVALAIALSNEDLIVNVLLYILIMYGFTKKRSQVEVNEGGESKNEHI